MGLEQAHKRSSPALRGLCVCIAAVTCVLSCRGDYSHKLTDTGKPGNAKGLRQHREAIGDELCMAALGGDVDAVESLLDGRLEVDARHSCGGFTALQAAAAAGHNEVVELLLGRGAQVDVRSSHGLTALHVAVAEGRTYVMELLLNSGANVNARTGGPLLPYLSHPPVRGWTPLHFAAHARYQSAVALLLDKGAEVNPEDDQGFTPLHDAAVAGHTDVVTLLLAEGAKHDIFSASAVGTVDGAKELIEADPALVHARDRRGRTALYYAARRGDGQLVECLLAHGAEAKARARDGLTPLAVAASSGHLHAVKLLLANGAEVTSAALEAAVRSDQAAVLQVLLAGRPRMPKGAIANALCAAAEMGDVELAELLLDANADLNYLSPQYHPTPLAEASLFGHERLVAIFLAKGAEVNTKVFLGATALHLAASSRHQETVELLLQHGSHVNARDSQGQTPLGLALKASHDQVAEVLRRQGGVE